MSDTKIMLRECPFCGGEAETQNNIMWYWVRCKNCTSTSRSMSCEENAIEAWNTRKPMDRIVEQLEKAKEMAEKEMEECIFKALPYHDSTEGKIIGFKKAIDIVKAVQNDNH